MQAVPASAQGAILTAVLMTVQCVASRYSSRPRSTRCATCVTTPRPRARLCTTAFGGSPRLPSNARLRRVSNGPRCRSKTDRFYEHARVLQDRRSASCIEARCRNIPRCARRRTTPASWLPSTGARVQRRGPTAQTELTERIGRTRDAIVALRRTTAASDSDQTRLSRKVSKPTSIVNCNPWNKRPKTTPKNQHPLPRRGGRHVSGRPPLWATGYHRRPCGPARRRCQSLHRYLPQTTGVLPANAFREVCCHLMMVLSSVRRCA